MTTPDAGAPGGISQVAVIGGGLVGGSLAAAIRVAGRAEVTVCDADPQARAELAARGLADRVVATVAEAVAEADLVVAAVPAAGVADVLAAAVVAAPVGAILTDCASLKQDLTLEVESRLRVIGADPARFVGGHPMAGSERSGPGAADPALFQGATWILTPTTVTADDALHRLAGFLRHLGVRVLALPADRHDELVALVSHLPQVVASVLADVAGDAVDTVGEAVLAVAGGGFRDTTRIAASDPRLWVGILAGNRPAVREALAAYAERLETLRTALEEERWADVEALLTRASLARRQLVAKDTQGPGVDLVVALDDRPGGLAAATTALGELGINVEDVGMRHATEGRRGALLLRVAATEADRGLAALQARGLSAHLEEVDPGAHR